jgi:SSS family solute:Na+ symporter
MLVIIFILSIVVIVLFSRKKTVKVDDESAYLTGNKNLNDKQVTNVIMATIIGGASTIGTAQLAYKYGLMGAIYTVSAGLACYLLGRIFAVPLRKSNNITVTEFIGDYFGSGLQKYISFLSSLGLFIQLLAQLLAATAIMMSVFDLNFAIAFVASSVLVLIFVVSGGILSSDVLGKIKIVLIYLVLIISFVIIFFKTSSFELFFNKIPNFSEFILGKKYPINEILFDFVTSIVGVLSTQAYLQAIFSAKNFKAARNGAYRSALIIPIIGVLSVFIGVYMRIVKPNLDVTLNVFPDFLRIVFPEYIAGFFLAAIFIVILGTCSGLTLSLATNIYVDFIKDRFENPKLTEITKIRLIILVLICMGLIMLVFGKDSSILKYTYVSMGLRGSTILLPMVIIVFNKNISQNQYIRKIVKILPIIYIAWFIVSILP